jgi:hypothetical protein
MAQLATVVALAAACSKTPPVAKTPAASAQPGDAGSPAAAAALPAAATTSDAPLADLGVPRDGYLRARLLERCAVQYHEDPIKAESAAVQSLLGKAFVVDLSHAFDAPAKPGSKAKVQPLAPDTPEELAMRQKYRAAHALADAHTPTEQQLTAQLKDCLYTPELGLVSEALIDRYIEAFVAIACLQQQHRGADGQVDAVAHAQAAAQVFVKHQFQAADFSRMGMVFGRYPKVQSRLHTAKAKACPDPRLAAAAQAASGEWNGSLEGGRNGSLHLSGDGGHVKGAVQWLGATVKYADGGSETQALAVEGTLGQQSVALFGQVNGDWVRLEGKRSGDSLSGTWTAQRSGIDKFKGTWKAEKIPAPAAKP